MTSIYRFYKCSKENILSVENQIIYLYGAKEWEKDGECNFDVDIGTDNEYRGFLTKKLIEGFRLAETALGYYKFREKRIEKLFQYGLLQYLDTPIEFDTLLDIQFDEAKSANGIQERKYAIKQNFFRKSGISCFTADISAINKPLFWNYFTHNGEGFCVEYNLDSLLNYFIKNECGIEGSYIKYYENPPLIKFYNNNLEETIKTIREIVFSLPQNLTDEKEFRLAKIFQTEVEEKDKRREQSIPQESILSITFGPNITDENELKLKFITKRLNNIQLFKINEQFDSYYRYKIPC